jgi:ParB/RepB/Spo0J family partition protein
MVNPLDPFNTKSDVTLTEEDESRLAGLSSRDRARAIGRIRKARQEAAPPTEVTAPASVPNLGPLVDGQMLDGKTQYLLLPVAAIEPDPDQPRKTFRNVGELANNMKDVGLLQPITVRRKPGSDGRHILIYGERRLRAAQQLKWTHIPAMVKFGVKDTNLLVQQLTENSMREDLDPIEEARAIRAYMRQEKIATQQEAALKLGHSLAWVSNRLALLDLDEGDQEAVSQGTFSILAGAKKARERVGNTRPQRKTNKPEPHFGPGHPLANIARSRCRARTQVDGASQHPSIGISGACGSCWEDVIRQDATRAAHQSSRSA